MSKILVVVAHPDDEILGVGATIAKRVEAGDVAYSLIIGEGQTSRWDRRECADKEVVNQLHRDTFLAGRIIGYEKMFFEFLPDNRFDSVNLLDIVKVIEKYVYDLQPDIIYTHHGEDLNIDHRITNQAVLTATRPIGDYSVKEIYGFETVSSTEWSFGEKEKCFCPNVYVDVSATFEKKCSAMQKYESELCDFPHPRSLDMLEALAKVRGATVGKRMAEAFEVIRIVQ